jgi:GntR family transcriptional regulator
MLAGVRVCHHGYPSPSSSNSSAQIVQFTTAQTRDSGSDHDSPTVASMPRQAEPPYRLVSTDLRSRIEAGEWLPGEQLPTVRKIADHYHVAVSTARRAIGDLRDQGLVTVTPGWGVFRAS